MREIKFRAWSKEQKRMFSVPAWYFSLNVVTCGMGEDSYEIGLQNVEVMQFTGLKDKNGKDVYEGDIVEFDWEYGKLKQAVTFADGMFDPLVTVEEGYNALNSYHPEWFEIIGNIYENPELLK